MASDNLLLSFSDLTIGTAEERAQQAARMPVIENFSLRFVVHVGVDGCGNDRTVSEKGLDEAEIDTLLKQSPAHRDDRLAGFTCLPGDPRNCVQTFI